MAEVTSPGHKLGQMIGNFFEAFFANDLTGLCNDYGYYCDRKGLRPAVRGKSKKLTWKDKYGDSHDLDYVIEKGGSDKQKGIPIAFIELAWRRYTKHSRNKTGELEGSLLPLRETFPSCGFLGAIVAGEYTDGAKKQLISHGVHVLHIPFNALAGSFNEFGIDLNYSQKAGDAVKRLIITKWESLSKEEINSIKKSLETKIAADYNEFKNTLQNTLLRQVKRVVIIPLFGSELSFQSVEDAVQALIAANEKAETTLNFVKYEIQIRFGDGDRIEGTFHTREKAIEFLSIFK